MVRVRLNARMAIAGAWHNRGAELELEAAEAADLVALGFASKLAQVPAPELGADLLTGAPGLPGVPGRAARGRYVRRELRGAEVPQ